MAYNLTLIKQSQCKIYFNYLNLLPWVKFIFNNMFSLNLSPHDHDLIQMYLAKAVDNWEIFSLPCYMSGRTVPDNLGF